MNRLVAFLTAMARSSAERRERLDRMPAALPVWQLGSSHVVPLNR